MKTSCDDVSLSASINRTLQLRPWLLGPGTVASCAYSWTRLMHCKPLLLSVGVCKIEGLIVVYDQSCSLGTRIRLQMLVSPSRAKFVGKWFSPETLFICRPDQRSEDTSSKQNPSKGRPSWICNTPILMMACGSSHVPQLSSPWSILRYSCPHRPNARMTLMSHSPKRT